VWVFSGRTVIAETKRHKQGSLRKRNPWVLNRWVVGGEIDVVGAEAMGQEKKGFRRADIFWMVGTVKGIWAREVRGNKLRRKNTSKSTC